MPQLKDCVSSFKIDPAVTHQESYTTTILKWMQDNPAQTKRTTAARIARTMALGGVTKQSEKHIRMTIHNMCSRGMLTTVGGQGRAKKTFFINYLHKTMPKEVIERAPEADIKRHEKLAGIKLRDDSSEAPEQFRETDSSGKIEIRDPLPGEGPEVRDPLPGEGPEVKDPVPCRSGETEMTNKLPVLSSTTGSSALPNIPPAQAPAMNVPIELEKMPNGNFSLQLNINFTINSKS